MKLAGEMALVTGAGQGIGKAVALLLAQSGAKIIVNALHEESAGRTCRELTEAGHWAISLAADVSNQEAVNRMFSEAERQAFQPIDILVNNAAAPAESVPFKDTTLNIQHNELVTLLGVLNCTRRVLPKMIQAKRGRIINISSIAGRYDMPGRAIYSAANAGIESFSRALALEIGQYGINVNCVSPGATESPRFKARSEEIRGKHRESICLGRFAEPEEVAQAVLFLASDMSKYVTGSVIDVDGGFTGYPPYKAAKE